MQKASATMLGPLLPGGAFEPSTVTMAVSACSPGEMNSSRGSGSKVWESLRLLRAVGLARFAY